MSKHTFAIYKENLSHSIKGSLVSFKSYDIYNRLTKVLRIKSGDKVILFDEEINVTIESILDNKKEISGSIIKQSKNEPLSKEISLYIPILKKDDLEHSIYVSAEVGARRIIPVITEKSQKKLPQIKRLKQIIVSACEQSKNFIIPDIFPAKRIDEIRFEESSTKICFETSGSPLKNIFEENLNKVSVIVGPEGGFTEKETELLKSSGFKFFKLTNTILKSREAVSIGLGVLSC